MINPGVSAHGMSSAGPMLGGNQGALRMPQLGLQVYWMSWVI